MTASSGTGAGTGTCTGKDCAILILDMPDSDDRPNYHDTSYHVRQAAGGATESVSWVVERFSPLLMANARYRLGASLRQLYDPEDLVNDVWAVTLPKLATLRLQDERQATPVLLKFLSTTLVHKVSNLLRKHLRGKPGRVRDTAVLDGVPAESTGVWTKVVRRELSEKMNDLISELGDKERELFVLRGIEQLPYKEISVIVGRDAKVLAVEYHRIVQKLRGRMPGAVFDELAND